MNKQQQQKELKQRNTKIIAAYAKKPADMSKTAFSKLHNISTRTLGRILDSVTASKPATKQSTPPVVETASKEVTSEMTPTKQPEETTAPEVKPDQIISWTVTKDRFISVMLDSGQLLSIESDHLDYDEIIHNLAIANYKEALNKMSVKHLLSSVKIGGFEVNKDTLLFNGKIVKHDMVNDILSVFTREEPVEHMLRFLENLMMNPSDHMYTHLWKLIKNAGVTITKEGNVECFKLVDKDFMDIYTKTISNNVGDTVTMRRSEVDQDFNKTCSHGLHVCARQYIDSSGYGNRLDNNNILLKVLVKPQDFVAIPPDYQFTKARVCSYKVLSVVK